MKKSDILNSFEEKHVKAEDIAEKVMCNPNMVQELLSGISSASARKRFGSAKVLRIISERKPQLLYLQMDFFVNLLDSDNAILKWNALDIIANLTTADSDDKFDSMLFRKYCSFLHEGNLITAAHVVENLGKIAQIKPQFQNEITKHLLNVKDVPLPTEECRNILIGKTINAFNYYYGQITNKEEVISFVKKHLKNPRNATKVKAERFLKKVKP